MSENSLIWGTLGNVVFEFLKSPEYGSVTHRKAARFTEHDRIVSRLPDGSLAGQKPVKEIAGLELDTVSFSCKVSSLILTTLDLGIGGAIAGALGAGAFVPLGETIDDERFFTDVPEFLLTLSTALNEQKELPFFEGEFFMGLFTIDSLDMTRKHRKNGEILHATIRIDLTEWIA